MINILIDGNFISFSEFAMFSNYGKTKDPLRRERDQAAFIQGLSSRLFYIINSLPKGGRVVFCLDSRSWRKDFMEKYKERREDEDGNKGIMDSETKQIFYNLLAEFGEVLQKAGIISSKVQGAEGDDLLFKWAKFFNDRGEDCIVISGDYDMTQTVKGPESPWTVVWSNKTSNNKMFTMPGWIDSIEEPQKNTIFEFNVVHDQSNLAKLIRDSGASLQIMDVNHYILHKILIGDDGDDVPSSWKMKTTNSKGEEKWVRVTDKKAEKIIEIITAPNVDQSLSRTEWLDVILHSINPEAKSILPYFKTSGISVSKRMDEIAGTLLRVMGDVDDAALRTQVIENIQRNAKLVWLVEEMLPYNINQMINENIEKSLDDLSPNRAKWNKTALLEGTRFGKVPVAPRGFDPFSLMDLPDEDIS